MKSSVATEKTATLEATNIGGIDQTEVSFTPGITILTGRNATNRTSLLQAIMAAMGSDRATLKGDAESGNVTLSFDGAEYTRTLTRKNGTVQFSGDPYLDSSTSPDLFAFLLANNESRRAIHSQDDLRDVIMRPVDTDAIQQEITELSDERRQVTEELETLETQSDRLAILREERAELESKLADKSDELELKRRELDEADRDLDSSRERKSVLDEKMDELRTCRSSLERVRERLMTNQSSIAALKDELEEHEDELDELTELPAGELSETEARIDELRARKSALDSAINRLREVVRFNEEMLDGNEQFLASLDDSSTNGTSAESLTSELVDGGTRTCWTCGNVVDGSDIKENLNQLQSLVNERLEERSEIDAKLTELTDQKKALTEQQQKRTELERQIEKIHSEIEERQATASDLTEEEATLESELESIEAEVDDLQGEEFDEIINLHKQVNQLEFETKSIEEEINDLAAEIDDIETALEKREELKMRDDEISNTLQDLRTRIERLEESAVDEFNEHMETVLDLLQYKNIERIWLERVEREVQEGRRKVRRGFFQLHVVRSTDDGVSYEDTIDHLSESEQNVTGLVFALAGYLVHDVHEICPFMLLDSLEMIDPSRIVDLVEYFADFATYLVVALLPEDAAAFNDSVQEITTI